MICNLDRKPVFIEDKDVNKVFFSLLFAKKRNRETEYYMDFLRYFLCTSSEKYPDKISFTQKEKEKHILNLSFSFYGYNDQDFYEIYFSLPKDKIVPDYDIEDAFKFVVDTIMHPNVHDNKFNEDEFYHEKKYRLERFERMLLNKGNNNYHDLLKIIDKNKVMNPSLEERKKHLEKMTPEGLWEFYKECILNNNYKIYVYGNYDENKINYLINKYLKTSDEPLIYDDSYFKSLDTLEYENIEIQTDYSKTNYYLVYQFDNLKEEEKNYQLVLDYILYGYKLLEKRLRYDNNLVYGVSLDFRKNYGLFVIDMDVSYNKIPAISKIIDEIINETIYDKKFLEEIISKMKRCYEVNMLKDMDYSISKLENKVRNDIHFEIDKDIYDFLNDINIDKLIEVFKKIKKTKEVCFKGVEND